jgi:hypothetical protein
VYLAAKTQLEIMHKARIFHGDTRADSFLVIHNRGSSNVDEFSVKIFEFVHCGPITSLRFNLVVEDYRQLGEHAYSLIKEREARIRMSNSSRKDYQTFDAVKEVAWQDWKNTAAVNRLDLKFSSMVAEDKQQLQLQLAQPTPDNEDEEDTSFDHFGPIVNMWL